MTGKQHKPFDLQRALAGDKFARKLDMKEPTDWHYFKSCSFQYPIICSFEGELHSYATDGIYNCGLRTHDLVMLPKTKKLWLKVSKKMIRGEGNFFLAGTSNAYEYKSDLLEAMSHLSDDDFYTVQIEIEVD